jgi:hypothetical protein
VDSPGAPVLSGISQERTLLPWMLPRPTIARPVSLSALENRCFTGVAKGYLWLRTRVTALSMDAVRVSIRLQGDETKSPANVSIAARQTPL